MCFYNSMNVKAQRLAARYGKKSDILEIWKEIQQERYKITAFTNPFSPVITEDPQIQVMQWGLIPYWVKSVTEANEIRKKTYNARAETIYIRSSYRESIKNRRCLIPSTGYFEWHHNDDRSKTPYFIYVSDMDIFSIAGIYDYWLNPESGEELKTFSMITTTANKLTHAIHNGGAHPFRMPAIILPENESLWLNPTTGKEEIQKLMQPINEDKMLAHQVDRNLIKKMENDPTIIQKFN